MFDGFLVKRHRLSAVANGVLIGVGIVFVLFGGLIGIVSIAAGVGLEIWQRSRISREEEDQDRRRY